MPRHGIAVGRAHASAPSGLRRRAWLLAMAIGSGAPAAALGQGSVPAPPIPTPPPGSGEGDPAAGEVVVRGERLRGSAIADVAPVAVVGQEQIKALGVTSLTEMMNRLKPLTTSAGGGEPVFLLNGRRVSGFGELQSIPPEAVERTEVLPEQEGARFGFPPTVRVVNVVTRKSFRSIAVRQLAGTTTEGGGATNYAELVQTRIEGARRTSLSVSHLRQNRVLQGGRDIVPDPDILFATQGNVTGIGGNSLDPRLDALAGRPIARAQVPADPAARSSLASYAGGGTAVTDIGRYRTLQPHVDTVRVDGTVAAPIGRSVRGSLNLTMEAQRSSGLNGLAPALLQVPGGNPALPFADDVLIYRYLPDAVLRQRDTNLNLHAGGTVQGDHRRWSWNVTANYDRSRNAVLADQGVPLEAVQAAVAAGGDPLAALPPEVALRRVRNAGRTVTGTLVGKAVANGPVVTLPAGDARVTVSADYARSTSQGRRPGTAEPPLDLARTTRGASIDLDVPIVSPDRDILPFVGRVTANGTVGVSGVSNYGRLVNATYGLTWVPRPPVQLTASFNATRTPPGIALLAAPILASPNVPVFDFTTGTSVSVTTLSGGNPALAPERRQVMTLGVAVKPMRNREFRVNLDYLDTRIVDQTAYLGGATGEIQAAFPGLFVRDLAGRLVRADLRPVNVADERERKLRLTANLWTPIGKAPPPPQEPRPGMAETAPPPKPPKPRPSIYAFTTITWRLDDRLRLRPGSPTLDLLDGATLNGREGRPRWEVEGNVGGSIGPADMGFYARLQGATSVRSTLATSDLSFSGRTWLVLYGSLDAEKLTGRPWARRTSVQLTVENLLNDRVDVRDRTGATPNRFQGAYLDPLGRSVRLGVRKLF